MIKIRKARVEDLKDIRKISVKMTVSRKSRGKSGLLEYKTPGERAYKRAIEEGQFIYVFEDGGKVVGFLTGYGDEELKNFDFSKDEIVKFILDKDKDFVYCDCLCVESKYRRQRLGGAAIQMLMQDAKKKGYNHIYGAVAHKPKNEGAVCLMKSLKFRCREEIEVYNGLIFGIYDKKL